MLRFDPGHLSVKAAAFLLRTSYWRVVALLAEGALRGGRYASGHRYVDRASLLAFLPRRTAAQIHDLAPQESQL